MLFKDIKQNYPVYILNKQDITFVQGKVTSVSLPHMDNSNPMVMGKSVIDVAIEADGKSATYAIPENLGIVYAGDMVLSTDRDGIMREVEALKTSAEQAIKNVERQKNDCGKINRIANRTESRVQGKTSKRTTHDEDGEFH